MYSWLHQQLDQEKGGVDEHEAIASGLEDWERDTPSGASTMSCEQFMLSLFELADVYVESVDRDAYVIFLQDLFRNTTTSPASSKTKRAWKSSWDQARVEVLAQEISDLNRDQEKLEGEDSPSMNVHAPLPTCLPLPSPKGDDGCAAKGRSSVRGTRTTSTWHRITGALS